MIPLNSYTLCTAQIVAHIAAVWWLFNQPSWSDVFCVFAVYFFTGCLGMSVTYHRLLTHKSFRTHVFFEYVGTILATVGLTGSSLSWTAAHRLHHKKADQTGDPHSPVKLGYARAQFFSMFSKINIYTSPVISKSFHRWMHRQYFTINLLWGILLYVSGGLDWVLIFWLVPAAVLWNAGSFINTICHTPFLGYRRYSTPDRSVNNPVLGLFMWGEGWHNNHHRFQTRAKFGERWWEFDISFLVIWLISIDNSSHSQRKNVS